MGFRSLASGSVKLAILAIAPKDMKAPTLAEITAGIDASCRVSANGYELGPTGSETISEPALCDEIAVKDFGNSNFAGNLEVFRYFTVDGNADTATATDPTGDAVYQALNKKGTRVWLVERRIGKRSKEDFAVGDELRVYEVQTDDPQPGPVSEGYLKVKIPLNIASAELAAAVAAAA